MPVIYPQVLPAPQPTVSNLGAFGGGVSQGLQNSTDLLLNAILSGYFNQIPIAASAQTPGQFNFSKGSQSPGEAAQIRALGGVPTQQGFQVPAAYRGVGTQPVYQRPTVTPQQLQQMTNVATWQEAQTKLARAPLEQQQLEAEIENQKRIRAAFPLAPAAGGQPGRQVETPPQNIPDNFNEYLQARQKARSAPQTAFEPSFSMSGKSASMALKPKVVKPLPEGSFKDLKEEYQATRDLENVMSKAKTFLDRFGPANPVIQRNTFSNLYRQYYGQKGLDAFLREWGNAELNYRRKQEGLRLIMGGQSLALGVYPNPRQQTGENFMQTAQRFLGNGILSIDDTLQLAHEAGYDVGHLQPYLSPLLAETQTQEFVQQQGQSQADPHRGDASATISRSQDHQSEVMGATYRIEQPDGSVYQVDLPDEGSAIQVASHASPLGDIRIAPFGPPLRDIPSTVASAANQALLGIPKFVTERFGGTYPEPHSLPGKILASAGAVTPFGLAERGVGLATRALPELAYRVAASPAGRAIERGAVGAMAGVLSNVMQPKEYAGRSAGFAAGNVVLPPIVNRLANIPGDIQTFRNRLRPQTIHELMQVPQDQVRELPAKDQQKWFQIRREQVMQALKSKGTVLTQERDVINRELGKATQERALDIRQRLASYLPERSKHFRQLFEADMAGRENVPVEEDDLRQFLMKRYANDPETLTAVSARLGMSNPTVSPFGKSVPSHEMPLSERTLESLYQQAKDFGQTLPQSVRQATRLYNADEYMTDQSIGTLIDFLDSKGVNLSASRGFWRETKPVVDQAVSEFRPFNVAGTRTQVASSRLKKLALGIDPDNEVYAKTLADYLEIDSLPGELKRLVAKLDTNQKSQMALQLEKVDQGGQQSPLAQLQYVAGKQHETSMKKWNRVLSILKLIGYASGGYLAGRGVTEVLRRE